MFIRVTRYIEPSLLCAGKNILQCLTSRSFSCVMQTSETIDQIVNIVI